MVTILLAVVSLIAFRFRNRTALELKLIALQHQLAVLHRQRPGRPLPDRDCPEATATMRRAVQRTSRAKRKRCLWSGVSRLSLGRGLD